MGKYKISLLRLLVLITLPALSYLGYYNTFHTAGLNGTGRFLFAVLEPGNEARFPGRDEPLLRYYTGNTRIDSTLTMLVAFFAHTVDGSVLWFGKFGAGQFGAAWALLVMEGLREGNRGRLVSLTGVLGILIQLFALTCMAPLYLLLILLTSPASAPKPSKESLQIKSNNLAALPDTILLSYFVPTLLMSLDNPAWINSTNHQRLIALWQIFPLLTTIIHYFLTRFWFSDRYQQLTGNYHFDALSIRPYIVATSAGTYLLPILMSIYQGKFIDSFVPYSLRHSATTPVADLATGVKNFLQWDIYIASVSIFVWAAYLYWEARRSINWQARNVELMPWWKHVGIFALGGPVSGALMLQEEREKMVFEPIEGYIKRVE